MSVHDAIAKLKRVQVAAGITPGQQPTGSGLLAMQAVNEAMDLVDRMGGEAGDSDVAEAQSEIKRILGLPLIQPLTDEEYLAFCRENSHEAAYQDGFRFNRLQVEGAMAFLYGSPEAIGVVGHMAVGTGKTLLLQLIASLAMVTPRSDGSGAHEKIVQLLPKNLIDPYLRNHLPFARKRMPIRFHVHSFADLDPTKRNALATSNYKGVYLLPYSVLSREASVDILGKIKPSMILADESHMLANEDSATHRRVFRYLDANPEVIFVEVSGSATKKGPKDYGHNVNRALKSRSPLPHKSAMLHAWGAIVEAGAVPSSGAAGPIRPLIVWAKNAFPAEDFPEDVSGFRKALAMRLQSTPGVVCSTNADDIPTSLCYVNVPVEEPESTEGWSALQTLIEQVRLLGETPNGDRIAHAIHEYKWYYELHHGFYNELFWPELEVFAKRKRLTDAEAEAFMEMGKQHHAFQQVYTSMLREWLKAHKSPMGSHGPIDTPLLVGNEMARTQDKHVPVELYWAWQEMKDAEIPGMASRDDRAVRVCPFKIDHAVAWAKQQTGGILWVYHQEIGRWLFERMKAEGLNVAHCPAGAEYGVELEEGPADKFYVTSIAAHHKGLNMQHHANQFFVQWPRDATHAEQTVGRLHRQGQKADHLDVVTCLTSDFDHKVFSATAIDALYVHQCGGGRQKLIYGDHDPPPRMFTPEVLKQQGLEPEALDREHRKLYVDKFMGDKG